MRCGRSDRIDLEAFLLEGEGDEALDDFRTHYPACADCAAVVADWMALAEGLRRALGEREPIASAHPEPEELTRFVSARAELTSGRATAIERHLARCRSCTSEMRAIERFDPRRFGATAESSAPPAIDSGGLFDWLSGLLDRLRGVELLAPIPALVAAVLVLGGLWLSGVWTSPSSDWADGGFERSAEPSLAERSQPRSELEPEPTSVPARSEDRGERMLASPTVEADASPDTPQTASPTSPPAASPSGSRGPREEQLADAPALAAPAPSPRASAAGAERVAGADPAPRAREIRIAALTELPPPDYHRPADVEPIPWMRSFGATRAASAGAQIRALAPQSHAGRTAKRSPRLWWSLERATEHAVAFTLVEEEALDPLVEVELPGPHAAGLHVLDLATREVALRPGIGYRWFVSLRVDPERPARDPIAAGALQVVAAADDARADPSAADAADAADAAAQGRRLAAEGLWYDAFDFYATLAAAHPDVARLAADRDRLAEVVRAGD